MRGETDGVLFLDVKLEVDSAFCGTGDTELQISARVPSWIIGVYTCFPKRLRTTGSVSGSYHGMPSLDRWLGVHTEAQDQSLP